MIGKTKYFWEVWLFLAFVAIIVISYRIGFDDGVHHERSQWVQLQTKDTNK